MFFVRCLLKIDFDFRDESMNVIFIGEHPDGFESLFMSSLSSDYKDDKENENDDSCYDGCSYISHTFLPGSDDITMVHMVDLTHLISYKCKVHSFGFSKS